MQKLIPILLILSSGLAFAIADALIKKAALHTNNFWVVLRNPLMIPVSLLYLSQVTVFIYVFIKKWDLGITGLLQMIIYAALVILIGIIFFQEKITITHGLGMLFALLAAILMNL